MRKVPTTAVATAAYLHPSLIDSLLLTHICPLFLSASLSFWPLLWWVIARVAPAGSGAPYPCHGSLPSISGIKKVMTREALPGTN